MKQTRVALMAAALIGGLGALAGFGPNAGPFEQEARNRAGDGTRADGANNGANAPVSQRVMASIFGGMGSSRSQRKTPGPGWSNRHVKRMARKARNVKTNRANHK